ncbi:STM4013/SEN3800 family hydrolase [Granulicoccus phenolivorans]|uniref:STM4013/SEN3800 family hydrolase n=1 Tax=Granulicoccus phenolivorans TaxID=266854 RepID=UPI00041037C6|nr:STM4013/SEN3800 family hydrolase [Granulicoccus phenolivorans]
MLDAATHIAAGGDIVWITLDSLRHDVAVAAHAAGQTPNLAALLGPDGWQRRHSPGSFTLPAHQAFLTGFLPDPPGAFRPPRMFAGSFAGAVGVRPGTFVFEEPSLPGALAARGYRTACFGGVGFFSGRGAFGRIIPDLFGEWYWSPATGPQSSISTAALADTVCAWYADLATDRPVFALINVATTHTPTHLHLPDARRDTVASQAAALAYSDQELGRVLAALRRPTLLVICSDHGDCFGEDGYHGHGVAHPHVWTVPYWEGILP